MELGVGKIASREFLKPAAQLYEHLECWNKLSLVLRKPVFGVSDQVNKNGTVQPQKMARDLKF